MNEIVQALFSRKSTRSFEERPISSVDRNLIIDAAIQAPTAKNQVLYTILEIDDQDIKDKLALSCDNQPFIAKAPLVLIFLADCRRWPDSFRLAGIDNRNPGIGDLMLACVDATIAAQNAVVAASSLGIGSCYIADILGNHDRHVELLDLDEYVLPVAMLVFGYPKRQEMVRSKPKRFAKKFIVRKNTYSRLSEDETRSMFEERHSGSGFNFQEYLCNFYKNKYMDNSTLELTDSLKKYLETYGKQS